MTSDDLPPSLVTCQWRSLLSIQTVGETDCQPKKWSYCRTLCTSPWYCLYIGLGCASISFLILRQATCKSRNAPAATICCNTWNQDVKISWMSLAIGWPRCPNAQTKARYLHRPRVVLPGGLCSSHLKCVELSTQHALHLMSPCGRRMHRS